MISTYIFLGAWFLCGLISTIIAIVKNGNSKIDNTVLIAGICFLFLTGVCWFNSYYNFSNIR